MKSSVQLGPDRPLGGERSGLPQAPSENPSGCCPRGVSILPVPPVPLQRESASPSCRARIHYNADQALGLPGRTWVIRDSLWMRNARCQCSTEQLSSCTLASVTCRRGIRMRSHPGACHASLTVAVGSGSFRDSERQATARRVGYLIHAPALYMAQACGASSDGIANCDPNAHRVATPKRSQAPSWPCSTLRLNKRRRVA
jgi:hypothetical protein